MQDYSESDEMYSQVRALYARFGSTLGANVAKPQQSKQKIGAAVEKVVKVPELPKGIVITQPVPDAAKRLNPKPKSWDLPLELLQKPRAKYTMGTIIRVSELLASHQDYIGQVVTVAGWVRSTRSGDNEKLAFVQLSDGTCFDNLQLVVEKSIPNFDAVLATNTGYSIKATGLVIKSPAAGQLIEINVSAENHEVIVLGSANPKEYPIPKGKQNPETLRQVAHLRPRTNFIGAVARIRNNLAYATHVFFQTHGCLYVHTPIITSNDCEGAGEMFQVTTILKDKIKDIPQKDGAVDFTKDFFQKPTNLTVSGQLNVENFCCALSNVYTFGPTFRAEISRTYRHLAEFWMIEPEFAFADLFDNMDAAEAYVKFCINFALTNNLDDLKFLDERVKPGLIEYLRDIASQSFVRCSYTQGVEILMEAIKKGAKFEKPVSWGIDLGSEHERFLAEKVFKRPVCLYDYPKDIKAFYMKVTDDGKCVRAMDMLIPQVGELIGGSQREERYDVLVQRMKECKLNPEDYKAYLDLRKYGTIPHAGFGLGFERLVMMVTGVENIRDVIPFPRWVDNAEF